MRFARGRKGWSGYTLALIVAGTASSLVRAVSARTGGARKGLGGYCQFPDDCASGLECNEDASLCTRSCRSDDDCDDLLCVSTSGTGSTCIPRCDESDVTGGFQCVGGRPVECEQVGADIDCDRCGCPDGRCIPGVGCGPKGKVGEACSETSECESSNCSEVTGTCRVKTGDACDATNCDSCRVFSDWSSCSHSCEADYDCGGGVCVGDRSTGQFSCYERCSGPSSSNCPVMCSRVSSPEGDVFYCECDDCTIETSMREEGQGCTFGGACVSGECFGEGSSCDSFSCVDVLGVCAKTCAADSECPESARCVAGHCLATCTDSCLIGSCVPSGEVSICEPRLNRGVHCMNDEMCRSGHCGITGQCRGLAGSGEACTHSLDCMVGYCCEHACRAAC